MGKMYLIIAISAIVFGAYFYGVNITKAKCNVEYTQNNLNQIQKIKQNKKDIHETVYKTSMGDIRRILYDKYTIAE